MASIELSDTARAVLTYAIQNMDATGGLVEWFPESVKGGARAAVIKGLRGKGLIGADDVVTPAAFDALGMEAPATHSPTDAHAVLTIDADTTEAAAMVAALDAQGGDVPPVVDAPDDAPQPLPAPPALVVLDMDVPGDDGAQDDDAQGVDVDDDAPTTTTQDDAPAAPSAVAQDTHAAQPDDAPADDGTSPEVQAALDFLGFMDEARKWFKRSRGVPPSAVSATLARMRAAMAGGAVRAARATTTTTPRAARAPRPDGAAPTPRSDTKQARLIALMRRPEGVTMDALCAELDWIPHTARGVISGTLRGKLGLTVLCAGGVYRIPDDCTPSAAAPATTAPATPAPAAPADAEAPTEPDVPTTPRPVLSMAAWMPAGMLDAINAAAAADGADDEEGDDLAAAA